MQTKYAGAIIIAFLIATLCTTISCKKYSEGITWQANAASFPSQMLIRFTNANSTSPKNPGNFTVTISGKDADKVIDGGGDKAFKTLNGFLSLALKQGTVPSIQNPVTFSLYASIPGFAPVAKSFTITDTAAFFTGITTVEYAHPADGTSAFVKQTALNNGVSAALTLITQETATMNEACTITVEDGTQMLDAGGNPINANTLDWKVVHYGAVNPASLAAFPGGFNAPDVIGKNGQPIQGGVTFFTEGLLSMKLFAGSTEVKKFSKPLKISMEVSSDIINPETNEHIKAGDTIPIWSQEEETGQWKYESMATVFTNGNGRLAVNFNASHLSSYNCDNIIDITAYCQNSVIVTIVSPSPFSGGRYDVVITGTNGFYYAYRTNIPLRNGAKISFSGLPASGGIVTVINSITGKVAGSQSFSACQAQVHVNVTLPGTNIPNPVKVNLQVTAECSNQNAIVSPTCFAYVEAPAFSFENFINVINGGVEPFILQDNADYNVYLFYANDVYKATGKFNKNNSTFATNGGELSGTQTYDAATNTATLQLKVSIRCR